MIIYICDLKTLSIASSKNKTKKKKKLERERDRDVFEICTEYIYISGY